MAYNRRNLLHKIIEIQGIVLEKQRQGVTQKFVFDTEIAPKYFISYATFNNYIARNAKGELEKLDRSEAEKKRQLCLF